MLEGTTILLVEDEDPLRKLYVSWLEGTGATLRQAPDGKTALRKWDEDVDVVVLDRRLPEMYGDNVLETARENGLHTPVVMVTAVDPDLDVIDMEFDGYMTKPLEPSEFKQRLQDLVAVSEVRDTVREFARVGLTLHRLQDQHSTDMLRTHSEYNRLHKRYKELHTEVAENVDDLTDFEKKLLLTAQDQLS